MPQDKKHHISNTARRVFIPSGTLILMTATCRDCNISTTGFSRLFIDGLGPNQTHQIRIMFSLFMRMLGGRLLTTKYTGQRLSIDDLKTAISASFDMFWAGLLT